jgi:hypothetical protein
VPIAGIIKGIGLCGMHLYLDVPYFHMVVVWGSYFLLLKRDGMAHHVLSHLGLVPSDAQVK